jgi:ABC-type sugar transport system ATPase subunit
MDEFSGGNQQKGIIAKFSRLNPDLLVVDEPTQGVDIGGKQEIGAVLRRFADDGGSVVLASSDLDEVVQFCDRVLVLDRGRTRGVFDADEITERSLSSGVEALLG